MIFIVPCNKSCHLLSHFGLHLRYLLLGEGIELLQHLLLVQQLGHQLSPLLLLTRLGAVRIVLQLRNVSEDQTLLLFPGVRIVRNGDCSTDPRSILITLEDEALKIGDSSHHVAKEPATQHIWSFLEILELFCLKMKTAFFESLRYKLITKNDFYYGSCPDIHIRTPIPNRKISCC